MRDGERINMFHESKYDALFSSIYQFANILCKFVALIFYVNMKFNQNVSKCK